MSIYHGDAKTVQHWFNTSVNKCQRLQASFPDGLTYGQMLRSAKTPLDGSNKTYDIYPALRLEACHELFSMQYYGHDLTNMAANAIMQSRTTDCQLVRAFRIVDLSPPNMTLIRETATRLFSFLYGGSNTPHSQQNVNFASVLV